MTTVVVQVSASSDDAQQAFSGVHAVSITGTSTVLKGSSGDSNWVGARYLSLGVPNASTVTAASVSWWIPTGGNVAIGTSTGTLVQVEATATPATYTASNTNISGRTYETGVSWTGTGTAAAFNASVDLTTPVQTVVNLGGWSTSSNMAVALNEDSSATNLSVEFYDGSPSEASEISITYTGGGSTPAAPTGLSLALNSDGTIQGTWTNPSGTLTGNVVKIATNSGFTTGVNSYTITGGAVTTSTLESGLGSVSRDTLIYVEVAATNSSGTGTYSSYQSITTGPAAPTGLAVTNAPSPVASWTNPTPTGGATLSDNKIQYSTDMVTWSTIDIGSVVTSYTFTGLTAATLYYFRVSAVDTNGQGYYSGNWQPFYVTATFSQQYYTYAYTGDVVTLTTTITTAGPDIVTSGWTKVGGAASFGATLSDGLDSTYAVPPTNVTQALVTTLANCPSNLIAVTSVTANARDKATGADLAGAVVWVESASYYGTNGVNSNATGTGVAGYASNTVVPPGGTLTTSFANYSEPETRLYGTQGIADWTGAYICIVWDDNTGAYALAEASVTITYWTIAPPSTPTGLAVVNDGSSPTTALDVSWSAAATAATYDLGQASSLGGSYSDTTGISGTTDTISGLTPATEYSFEVAATNAGGTSSYSSAVAWATASAAPSGVSATPSAGAALVAWTAPTMGTNCQIASFSIRYEYPPGNGNWTTITGISSGATSYLVTGLTPGVQYGFEVACLISSSNSDWSGTIQSVWGTEEDATTTGLLAASAGTFSLTGKSVALLHAYVLSAAKATFTETGESVGLYHGYAVTAAAGSFSLTGEPASFARTYILAAADAVFTETAESVGLYHGYKLAATGATFTETGEAAGLYKGYDLSASDATFALTGESVAFLWTHVLSVGVAAFSETGEAAGLYKGYALPAAAASFTDTGENVAILDDRILPAALATFTLTAEAAVLTYGYTLTAAAASYDLTGEDVTFLRDYVVSASFGQFIEFGEEVDLLQGHVLNATLSVITLTGSNSVGFGLTLPAGAATYVFSGASSNLLWDHKLSASVATFSFTGKAVALSSPFSVLASAATFALTGESVTFYRDRTLTASPAVFALMGEPAALLHDHVLPATHAAFSDTGEAVAVLHDHKLPASDAPYSLIGKVAGLFHGYTVAAAKAVFSLTGESATLRAKRVLNATAAAFTRTGKPATFLRDRIMPAAAAVFNLTGKVATFKNQLDAADGQYALTGKPAALLHDHVLPATKATFALHGDPVLLALGFSVFASPASFSLTGKPVGFKIGEPASSTTYDLTARSVTLLHDRTLLASKAVYSLTGNGVDLHHSRKLAAADATYTMTAEAAALLHNRALFSTHAGYAITGDPVLLSLGFSIFASPASFSLTGNAAGFKIGEPATPASYDLTGKTATLLHDRTLPAAKAIYSLTGESVGLHHGRKLAAADATYAMTAKTAALLHDRALFSTHAGYSLTGDAAGLGSTRILTASHAVFTETAEAAGVYKGYDLNASLATFTETAEASALHYDRVLAASLASFTLILIAPNVTQVSYVYPAAAQFLEQGGVMGDIQVVGGVSAAFQDAGATEGDVRPSQSGDP